MRGVRQHGQQGGHGRRRDRVLRAVAVGALAGVLGLAGCSSAEPASTSTSDDGALQGELTIFAAASLTASFSELAEAFGAENPGVTIAPISFDGSSTLATQISEGAPADVFASADDATMQQVSAELATAPVSFASNELQIAVQPGNPLDITALSDLAEPAVQVALCAPAVPCGAASHILLDNAEIALTPVTEEQNVTAVLTKVELGEVDAGLVYVTDVLNAAGAVEGVEIVNAATARNTYPIAVLNEAVQPAIAAAFVDFVLSAQGQSILASYGFSTP
ncbi:molybdate ABC transporter substrate-binding protein [Salinibacterium sp. NK8237]|uniref:molybdate ABC transporter substrate-binding protein n=1 Tax=Salinibacterium sp. NK8237 TaxID=2792038 RepID=UPI0018CE6455|nr:molybdate ABC transporter substrate-binding protein [Salinibacterium sp. NK8237]MBH0130011.1 molybdate ABC transporter substrate-binding protein [Salinibacterium sp. NK8237]